MSVRERIAAIRLVEKLAKNKAYAEKIGVVAGQGKGVESREWERKGKQSVGSSYQGYLIGTFFEHVFTQREKYDKARDIHSVYKRGENNTY